MRLLMITLISTLLTLGSSYAQSDSVIEVTTSGNPDGRTVVLIPGLASSAAVWDETEDLLEADYDVRTVQVAGFAGADAYQGEGTYTDAIAAALIAHLKEDGGIDPVLVGHSMGGFVSMKAALADSGVVNELLIVDSLPFLAGMFFPGATPEVAAEQAPVMVAQMKGMTREAFDAQQAFGLARLSNTADFIPTLTAWSKGSDQATISNVMGELIGTDLRSDIAAIEVPTTVLVPWAQAMGLPKDRVQAIYTEQYGAMPNAEIRIIDEAFHFIMIDQKAAFDAALLGALED